MSKYPTKQDMYFKFFLSLCRLFLLLIMVSLKHSISLYISISIFYFTPLISHHLPLSSYAFNPPIMPSRSKIQYKASPYPRSSNAGVSLLRLKIWDLGNKERGDWGVRTMYWSVRGLGQGGSKFFNFCELKLEINQTRSNS